MLSYSYEPEIRDFAITFHFARYCRRELRRVGAAALRAVRGRGRARGRRQRLARPRRRRARSAFALRGVVHAREARSIGGRRLSGGGGRCDVGGRLTIEVRRIAEHRAVRHRHARDDAGWAAVLRGARVHGDLVAGLENRRAPARAAEDARRPALDCPLLILAVRVLDDQIEPRVWIHPAPFLDGAGQRDDLVDLVGRVAVVRERRKRRQSPTPRRPGSSMRLRMRRVSIIGWFRAPRARRCPAR